MSKNKDNIVPRQVLLETLSYSRSQDYVGYDKHDGMSSKMRGLVPGENKWVNLVFQESIKRSPVNLRPIFLVQQRPNPKGLSLFCLSNHRAWNITGDEKYRSEAERLGERVISHDAKEFNGFGVGHSHKLQNFEEQKQAGVPGIVQTSYATKALLELSEFDSYFLNAAGRSAEFLKRELDPEPRQTGVSIKYNPTDSGEHYTVNANALGARMLIDLYMEFEIEEYLELATDILEYVASKQTDIGGWEYKDPPSASHLGMDNYHNGFIIESFLRYQEVVDSGAFEDTVEDGLAFYREILYEDTGAPCWDESSAYPRDIHAAAQGIIVFTHAGDLEFARRIIDWTIDNLYAGDGQFYYQKRKYYTKRFTLMRWCQAWMAYAISLYLKSD